MGIETAIGGALGLAGGLMGQDSARKAANQQNDAARNANQLSWEQADQARRDNLPFFGTAYGANDLIATLLGMPAVKQEQGETYDQIRARLAPQFTNPRYGGNGVDDAGLNRAASDEYNRLYTGKSTVGGDPNSPLYGLLTKQFTGADLQNDPGYQFGLQQGQRALDNRLAANGNYYSGSAIKQAARYNQDYAGTKFNEAWNRDQTAKGNMLNNLLGITGRGQTSVGQVNSAGMQYGNTAGNNLIGAGDARAAGSIARGNALTSALNGAAYGARNAFGGGSSYSPWSSIGINPSSTMTGWNSPSNADIWTQMMGG